MYNSFEEELEYLRQIKVPYEEQRSLLLRIKTLIKKHELACTATQRGRAIYIKTGNRSIQVIYYKQFGKLLLWDTADHFHAILLVDNFKHIIAKLIRHNLLG